MKVKNALYGYDKGRIGPSRVNAVILTFLLNEIVDGGGGSLQGFQLLPSNIWESNQIIFSAPNS